jgi:hypothetical protein
MGRENSTKLDRTTPKSKATIARVRERHYLSPQHQSVMKPFERWCVVRVQGCLDARASLRLKERRIV